MIQMKKHLLLNLESPLMSFGGETVDNYGVTRRFPSASMLTGLLANALGWRRTDRELHQRLQDRLVFAARIDREPAGGVHVTDFQTAQLNKNDSGWTTRGEPEGRAGGVNAYNAPHLRYRDYFADMRASVALRLDPSEDSPTLEELAVALDNPKRPLFIGRKPCLPSAPIYAGFSEADTALAALLNAPLLVHAELDDEADASRSRSPLLWPDGEGADGIPAIRTYTLTDERNWRSTGLHGGGRIVNEGISEPIIEEHPAELDNQDETS